MRTFINVLFRFALAFFAVVNAVLAFAAFSDPEIPLYRDIEYAALTAVLVVLLVAEFVTIPWRYLALTLALLLTYSAVTPEYTLWTALTGALAGIYIVATVLAFWYHREVAAHGDEWTDGEDDGGDDEIWLRADVAEDYRKARESDPTLTVADYLKREKL